MNRIAFFLLILFNLNLESEAIAQVLVSKQLDLKSIAPVLFKNAIFDKSGLFVNWDPPKSGLKTLPYNTNKHQLSTTIQKVLYFKNSAVVCLYSCPMFENDGEVSKNISPHSMYGLVSLAVFDKTTDKQWKLNSFQWDVALLGHLNYEDGEYSLLQIASDRFGIIFKDSEMHQGQGMSQQTLFIEKTKGKWVTALELYEAYSGEDSSRYILHKITSDKKSRNPYYDLIINTTIANGKTTKQETARVSFIVQKFSYMLTDRLKKMKEESFVSKLIYSK